ncbi:hypothetical protein GH714_030219 [Hevea brasiliensis]|uniref:Uncharacterized protein n=1 Tax=Hevea brasiliensis TaxID=3981 RepID=A0A6A6NBR2_HEVBR|nr:hypothetical protein GH714_030219 [Hevea brasiliensis]
MTNVMNNVQDTLEILTAELVRDKEERSRDRRGSEGRNQNGERHEGGMERLNLGGNGRGRRENDRVEQPEPKWEYDPDEEDWDEYEAYDHAYHQGVEERIGRQLSNLADRIERIEQSRGNGRQNTNEGQNRARGSRVNNASPIDDWGDENDDDASGSVKNVTRTN